ncbi:hypothetical protein N752_07450 [Desulforamulus aquiferis]|nr:hypothetical protein N752_07450 [Desulforamulus aquiferis]
MDLANTFAPEHLEIMVDEPFNLLGRIKNAGAIFLGHHSPEPVGDYLAGPNHVLPTNGTARFYSPLNVDTFMKNPVLFPFPSKTCRPLDRILLDWQRLRGLKPMPMLSELG